MSFRTKMLRTKFARPRVVSWTWKKNLHKKQFREGPKSKEEGSCQKWRENGMGVALLTSKKQNRDM
jgi:hypothetical protein